MTFSLFIRLVGVTVAASWGAYALEQVQPIHPMVRRGAQITLSGLAALYALHILGLVRL